jgi:hypothetical protein
MSFHKASHAIRYVAMAVYPRIERRASRIISATPEGAAVDGGGGGRRRRGAAAQELG